MSKEISSLIFKVVWAEWRNQSSDWEKEEVNAEIYDELNELGTRVEEIVAKEVARIRKDWGK